MMFGRVLRSTTQDPSAVLYPSIHDESPSHFYGSQSCSRLYECCSDSQGGMMVEDDSTFVLEGNETVGGLMR